MPGPSVAFPLTHPATLSSPPAIARNKYVVLANTGISWGLSTAQYYCDKRGIPRTNIFPYNFGSDLRKWAPALIIPTINALLASFKVFYDSLGAKAVLFGPGVPAYLELIGTWNPSTLTWSPAALCHPALTDVFYCISNVQDSSGYPWPQSITYLYGRVSATWPDYGAEIAFTTTGPPPAGEHPLVSYSRYTQLGDDNLAAGLILPLGGFDTAAGGCTPSTEVGLTRIGTSACIGRPVGIIASLNSWDNALPPGYVNNEATALTLINRATTAMTAHNQQTAFSSPVLYSLMDSIAPIGADYYINFIYLNNLWKINNKYYWRMDPAATTLGLTYAPEAGAAYDYRGGEIPVNDPYYLYMGIADNAEMYVPPYPAAWSGITGAGNAIGPSNGHHYGMYGISNTLSVGTILNLRHITNASETANMLLGWYLMRGMTWLEASFAVNASWIWNIPAIDPLWAPYAPVFTDPGPQNTSATQYRGRQHIDQRTGFKSRPRDLKTEWTGILTERPEPRHPQDYARPLPIEKSRGSRSPEPADTFVDTSPPVVPTTSYDASYISPLDLNWGHEVVGTNWFSVPLLVDATGNGTGRDVFDSVMGVSFASIGFVQGSIISTATLILEVSVPGGGGTWTLFAQLPPVGQCQIWSTANRPVASGAVPVATSIPGIDDAITTKTLDVTSMVNDILAGANWIAGGRMNFWGESIGFGTLTFATARLVITL